MDRLDEILSTMDIPQLRKNDYRWLLRNIKIRNNNHPYIEEAIFLITEQMKMN